MDLNFARGLKLDSHTLTFAQVADFAFLRSGPYRIELSDDCLKHVRESEKYLHSILERKVPLYGVTTGFGDSCHRVIQKEQSEALQHNLVAYLRCGTGPELPVAASRAIFLLRLKSLSRGYSGVSVELLERMKLYLERDWIPVIPREGSLGASGDLVPLAYVAAVIAGEGFVHANHQKRPVAELLKEESLAPYRFKPKEGLALVNGTSAMAGLSLVNLSHALFLSDLACVSTSWLCMALRGRTEAFGSLVNERAKAHPGQARAARRIFSLLEAEDYRTTPLDRVRIENSETQEFIQDRYSLRCAPQILGPVFETINQIEGWLELEFNGTSDNPLISDDGELANGGNFYGGYLSHGMDYLKICVANMADMIDRQLMFLMDEKSNRGLPPNLANWSGLPVEERFLHHGLKGLHQAVSAICSEILARATPNSIFSRSSESHNQDKVSLGMSAAVQCSEMIDPYFRIQAMYLSCLAQALDIRCFELKGAESRALYELVRSYVPFCERDTSLGEGIQALSLKLKELAEQKTSGRAAE